MLEAISPVLRKPTGTIQISNPFSFGERKLLNTLMCDAQTEDGLTSAEQFIPLEEVYEGLGWRKSKDRDELKAYLRKLITTGVQWNEFGVDNSTTWAMCTFLASGKLERRGIRYRINPEIVQQVKRPILYAKLQLLAQGQLKKKHSLVLYEYFQDEIGRSPDKVVDLEDVKIARLLQLLRLSEYYKQYKFLNQDVLKTATKEINNLTDVSVTYKAVRHGKKTVGVHFTVMRDESFQLAFDLDNATPSEYGTATGAQIADSLEYCGMSPKVAAGVVKKYSAERILGNIEHMEEELRRGTKIQNRGAWLRRAIEEDWRPMKTEAEKKETENNKKAAEEQIKKKQAEKRREKLEKEFDAFRHTRVEEVFNGKSKAFQTRRRKAFLEKMQEEKMGMVLRAHARDGWESPMVKGCFFSELRDELLTEEHETSIAAYEAWITRKES